MAAWKRFDDAINQYGFYTEESEPLVDELVETLLSQNLVSVDDMHDTGTNLKLIFTYEDGSMGVFKPKRLVVESTKHYVIHTWVDSSALCYKTGLESC